MASRVDFPDGVMAVGPGRATPARPRVLASQHGSTLHLTLIGAWTIGSSRAIEDQLALRAIPIAAPMDLQLDLTRIERMDTAGAYLLHRAVVGWQRAGHQVGCHGASETAAILLDTVKAHATGALEHVAEARHPGLIGDAVRSISNLGADTLMLTGFLGHVVSTLAVLVIKPWRFRFTAFMHHLEHAGLRALPIVSLVCLLIGAVVMQQGATQLKPFGADIFAVNLLAVLSLREVGVLLTAVMIAGRSGSAYTAEIGAMKMRQEIDAMRTLGLDPMATLVIPRLLALLIVMPVLTFLGSMMCLAGGGITATLVLGLDWTSYLERLRDAASMNHLFVGMIKTPVMAIIIGMVGCMEGLKVRGSAESLGEHVTAAVVKSIFLVLVIDGLFAIILAALGY